MLSSTNGHWSCPGMPGHGIPDIGMPVVTVNWALGMLGQALLVGIILPMPGQALLMGIVLPMLGY